MSRARDRRPLPHGRRACACALAAIAACGPAVTVLDAAPGTPMRGLAPIGLRPVTLDDTVSIDADGFRDFEACFHHAIEEPDHAVRVSDVVDATRLPLVLDVRVTEFEPRTVTARNAATSHVAVHGNALGRDGAVLEEFEVSDDELSLPSAPVGERLCRVGDALGRAVLGHIEDRVRTR